MERLRALRARSWPWGLTHRWGLRDREWLSRIGRSAAAPAVVALGYATFWTSVDGVIWGACACCAVLVLGLTGSFRRRLALTVVSVAVMAASWQGSRIAIARLGISDLAVYPETLIERFRRHEQSFEQVSRMWCEDFPQDDQPDPVALDAERAALNREVLPRLGGHAFLGPLRGLSV